MVLGHSPRGDDSADAGELVAFQLEFILSKKGTKYNRSTELWFYYAMYQLYFVSGSRAKPDLLTLMRIVERVLEKDN